MDQQLKETWIKLKEYWQNQTKKTKQIVIGVASAIVVISILTPIGLGFYNSQNFSVLYKGLTTNESAEIYSKLQEMNIPATMNQQGEILVPNSELNYVKMQLSTLGYPKTGLSYDVFTSNAGFIATELEKKQYLIMDLQNRLQETIKQIGSVSNAIVTLNIPEDSNYIWNNNQKNGSASVMLTLKVGNSLSPELVAGIQNLVSSSVPYMNPESVAVIDAATGTQLQITTNNNTALDDNFLQIEFESQIERKMEEKILNLLSLPYGLQNIRVSATVVVDYDKMLEEQLEYIPGENGEGIMSKLEEWYIRNGNTNGGIAGEDSNTDTPTYPNGTLNSENADEYSKNAEYLVSYIKRQIEKNNAVLKSSSISVVIVGNQLSTKDVNNWVSSIAKAVNVDEENVIVNSIFDENAVAVNPNGMIEQYLPYILIGICVLLLLIIIIIIIVVIKKRKHKTNDGEDYVVQTPNYANLNTPIIETPKEADPQQQAVKATLENIQEFTVTNPEMAANLIRDMLKERE